jgi:hypothetical protein
MLPAESKMPGVVPNCEIRRINQQVSSNGLKSVARSVIPHFHVVDRRYSLTQTAHDSNHGSSFGLSLRSHPLDLASLLFKLALLSRYLMLGMALRNLIILQFIANQHAGSHTKRSANCRTGARSTHSRTDYCARPGTQDAASESSLLTC